MFRPVIRNVHRLSEVQHTGTVFTTAGPACFVHGESGWFPSGVSHASKEGDEGYSLVPHQGTGPIRLREVRRSSMGCNIEAIKPFVKQGPLRLVRCLAERQTSRHLSKRLMPMDLFTLEEFVMLDVWSLAHSYLLTIDYRVVGRAVACLFSCVLTGASRDKLCRIFTTAWRNFGRALMWLKLK